MALPFPGPNPIWPFFKLQYVFRKIAIKSLNFSATPKIFCLFLEIYCSVFEPFINTVVHDIKLIGDTSTKFLSGLRCFLLVHWLNS